MIGNSVNQFINNTLSASAPTGCTEILPLPITPVFITDHLGNIGIGTPTPDARLAVNGTVHAREVKVDTNFPVPDYVFSQDY